MEITRKRYVVMRKNRTEIWCGWGRTFHFKHIDQIGETEIKTYRTRKKAESSCSSLNRYFEVVEVTETIKIVE